jgi:hypothetical protein
MYIIWCAVVYVVFGICSVCVFIDSYFLNVMYCILTSSMFCLYNLDNVSIQISATKAVKSGQTGVEPFDSDVPKIRVLI